MFGKMSQLLFYDLGPASSLFVGINYLKTSVKFSTRVCHYELPLGLAISIILPTPDNCRFVWQSVVGNICHNLPMAYGTERLVVSPKIYIGQRSMNFVQKIKLSLPYQTLKQTNCSSGLAYIFFLSLALIVFR